jgi:flavin reductase (DIM6/NTAB) family NADH-FMN oxidoreductase RutF
MAFRQAMGRFGTGITVVTTSVDGGLYGLTVSAFCSVSLDPPLALVCIDHLSRSCQLLAESGVFAVNVLAWEQQFLADRFAARGPLVDTAFTGVPYHLARTGAPILSGAIAWADCRVTQTVPTGDHDVFIGSVLSVGVEEGGEPLLLYRGHFERLKER